MKYHGTVFDVTGQFPSLPVSRSGYALRDLNLNVVDVVQGGFVELEDHNGGAPLASRAVPQLCAKP